VAKIATEVQADEVTSLCKAKTLNVKQIKSQGKIHA
jgi:hypothetical protein